MSCAATEPMQIYVRHQHGASAMLTFHLGDEQRLRLIEALAAGRAVEVPAHLELTVLPQWIANRDEDVPHATIPLHAISFNLSAPNNSL